MQLNSLTSSSPLSPPLTALPPRLLLLHLLRLAAICLHFKQLQVLVNFKCFVGQRRRRRRRRQQRSLIQAELNFGYNAPPPSLPQLTWRHLLRPD